MIESPAKLASYIDHTLLSAFAQPTHILHLCEEAKAFHFKAVCVNSSYA